jgi:hypothetical protein
MEINKHIIQIELPTHAFDRRDRLPETMRYRVNNPAVADLLQEIEDAFWLDLGADHCHSNPPRLSIGMDEVRELIGWAQRQLSGINVRLWEGTKAQMFRWDTEIPLSVTHASVVSILWEDRQWKVTHVEYMTPAQFQKAMADGALGRRDRTTMKLGEFKTILYTVGQIPALVSSVLQKRHASIAYDKAHPAVNNITGRDLKRRVLPAAKADTARLDWLAEHLDPDPDFNLRKYIDDLRAGDRHPLITLNARPNPRPSQP